MIDSLSFLTMSSNGSCEMSEGHPIYSVLKNRNNLEVKMRTRKRPPLHPGRILYQNYLEQLNISVTKMAEILGVSRKTLSNIVNEHKSITPEMALRLSKALNTTPDLWLNIQKNYDLWHTAHETQAWKKVKPVAIRNDVSSLQA